MTVSVTVQATNAKLKFIESFLVGKLIEHCSSDVDILYIQHKHPV